MQRNFYLFFISLLSLLLFGAPVSAVHLGGGIYCVNDDSALPESLGVDFQDALTKSINIDGELRLIGGTVTDPAIFTLPTATGNFAITTNNSLEISGGWDDT